MKKKNLKKYIKSMSQFKHTTRKDVQNDINGERERERGRKRERE